LAVLKLMEEFDIPVHGLKEGIYNYDFKIQKGFFDFFENPDLPGGDINLSLTLLKRSQFIELDFKINGVLALVCDRCLDDFDLEINLVEKLFIRFGDNFEELDDNVIVLPKEESRLNIAQFIYEFVALSVPFKRVHPDKKNGESGCNPEMIKKLNELKVDDNPINNNNIDPRWDKLRNLN